MSRVVSLVVLVACILLMAAVFIRVMAQFLLPMFMAVLLVVMFRPLHAWLLHKCGGRPRVAAGLTTAGIVLIVLIPLLIVFGRAAVEGYSLASRIDQESLREATKRKAGHALEEIRAVAAKVGMEVPDDQALIHTVVANVESWVAPAALRTTHSWGRSSWARSSCSFRSTFFWPMGPRWCAA